MNFSLVGCLPPEESSSEIFGVIRRAGTVPNVTFNKQSECLVHSGFRRARCLVRSREWKYVESRYSGSVIIAKLLLGPVDSETHELVVLHPVSSASPNRRAIRELNENVKPSSAPFQASFALSVLVDKSVVNRSEAERGRFAAKLHAVIVGMFQSIADAQVYSGGGSFQVSEGSKFVRSITRGLQSRIVLDPYEGANFFNALYLELLSSCPLSMNNWTLDFSADGSLYLTASSLATPDPGIRREAVKIARSKSGIRVDE